MSPLSYTTPTFLQCEVGERLMERLELIRLQPQRVLDLGCGTGEISELLLKKYRKAEVIGLDVMLNKVQETQRRGGWLRKPAGVCADVMQLPFKTNSVDMAMSNLLLHSCSDLPRVFNELAQVIRPEGLFLFSTLGPDTLHELYTSGALVGDQNYGQAGYLVDMHDVGDALLQAGFRDPVVDMEVITLTYADINGLLRELNGAENTDSFSDSPLDKQQIQQAYAQFKLANGQYPATFEVIYGHAWSPTITPTAKPERYIPIRSV